ncbi:MAG: hypothetical protein J6X43_07185 [Bacteroidales bacterium]|nr:hypothetical protein [Bacteroidales bacterium]
MKRFLSFVVTLIFLYSCASQKEEQDEKYGGTLSIPIYDINFDPYIFAPTINGELEKSLASIFYTGLFQYNPVTLSVENGICQSWDVDNTGLVYVFHLDTTAQFHKDECFNNAQETRKVTAYDVKYTFHLLANPKFGVENFTNTVYHIQGAMKYFSMTDAQRDTSRIEGITVIDEHTLKVTLSRPSPTFIQNLAHPAAAIIPYEAVEMYGTKSTVGIGPFQYQFDSSQFVFTRSDDFFLRDKKRNHLPYLDTLRFIRTNSLQEASNLFIQGKIDALLLVSGGEVSRILHQLPEEIDYEILESHVPNFLNYNGTLYNIVRPYVKGLHTNKLFILNFDEVYIDKRLYSQTFR